MILAFPLLALDPPPAIYGCVIKIEGKAWSVGPKGTRALQAASPILTKDRIRMSPQSSVSVRRKSDCRKIEFVYDPGRPIQSLPAPNPMRTSLADLIARLKVEDVDYRRISVGSAKGNEAEGLVPVSPRGTMLGSPSEFRWNDASPAGSVFKIASTNDASLRRAVKISEGASSYRWPSDLVFRPNVRYIWNIQGGERPANIVAFDILEPSKARPIQSLIEEIDRSSDLEPGERAVLKAQFLTKNGLYADALVVIEAAGASVPPSLAAMLRTDACKGLGVVIKGLVVDLRDDELTRQWSP